MNSKLIAVVETKDEEKRPEASTERLCLDLGEVSEDTQGAGFAGPDGGFGRIWFA